MKRHLLLLSLAATVLGGCATSPTGRSQLMVVSDSQMSQMGLAAFNDMRKQVSIFMSPLNVHINRNPVSGMVRFFKYHPGKFLFAWDPKSSTDNERTTIVVETENGIPILFRQIAGALARRIVWYLKEGDIVKQGDQFGFIKFGSRVDVFLPPGTKINVGLNEKVTGGVTVLAELQGK